MQVTHVMPVYFRRLIAGNIALNPFYTAFSRIVALFCIEATHTKWVCFSPPSSQQQCLQLNEHLCKMDG